SNAAYYRILPQMPTHSTATVAIYTKKQSCFNFCQFTNEINNPDILIVQISGPGIQSFKLFNVYNEKREIADQANSRNLWTVERALRIAIISNRAIICGDFNAHHHWWNSHVQNPVRSEALIS